MSLQILLGSYPCYVKVLRLCVYRAQRPPKCVFWLGMTRLGDFVFLSQPTFVQLKINKIT